MLICNYVILYRIVDREYHVSFEKQQVIDTIIIHNAFERYAERFTISKFSNRK